MYNTQSVAMETNYYIVACTLVHALLNVILYFTGGKTSNKNLKFEFNVTNNAFYLMLTGNFALNGKHKSYLKNRMIFGLKILNYCIH